MRVFVVMTRPTVVLLLSLFAATGLAQAGGGRDVAALPRVLVIVISYLVCSVLMNDLADEAIDRVNLPGDPSRLLASGRCTRRELLVAAVTAAVVALAGGAFLGGPALVVVAAGLALSAGYCLRPVRIADRGAAASLLLPAGYVAVPYLVGIFSRRPSLQPQDLVLLGGLYVGFIGRILLKDFRDVRGDALFGKRTFLVRHGRRTTCVASAICWVAGAGMLAGVRGLRPPLVAGELLCVALALALLRQLAVDRGPRRDERLIPAIAIAGRGMVLLLLGHLSMIGSGLGAAAYLAVQGGLTLCVLGQAWTMIDRGPTMRVTVPEAWAGDLEAPLPQAASPASQTTGGAHGA
jgi:4-hydroxybenzoate polyprenyltransferase